MITLIACNFEIIELCIKLITEGGQNVSKIDYVKCERPLISKLINKQIRKSFIGLQPIKTRAE